MVKIKLDTMLNVAIKYIPFFRKLKVSALKVEKVLKPPQNPTAKNKKRKLLFENFSFINPITIPKIKELKEFANNVP